MDASARAALIASIVARNQVLNRLMKYPPSISEIPLDKNFKSFGLMMNFFVSSESVRLTVLWSLTLPVIYSLHQAGNLKEFNIVEIRVIAEESDRVLSVQVTLDAVDRLQNTSIDDLLKDNADGDGFTCYWYRDKNSIPIS